MLSEQTRHINQHICFSKNDCFLFVLDGNFCESIKHSWTIIDFVGQFTFAAILFSKTNQWRNHRCKLHMLKESVMAFFPFFDTGAKDAARFFFGVQDPVVELHGGENNEP